MSMKPVEAVLIGAGMRGTYTFGGYAKQYPYQLKIVAIAELDQKRRERFARDFEIPNEHVFRSWEEMLAKPQLAPVLINASMDRSHFDSSMAALDRGYHILLEKPMATDPVSCIRLANKVQETGKVLQVCHSLRYNPFYSTLKTILQNEDVGDIVSELHNEHIAYWHYAHSFVRGNWSNQSNSSPCLLSKSCHDIDLFCWLADELPVNVSSFGSLGYFKNECINDSIPMRCTDGCPIESKCAYSAIKQYLGENTDWPVNTIAVDLSYNGRLNALQEGPYGRCVYRCDNDVVDRQVIIFEYADGRTLSFQMHGHSYNNVRTMRISASNATICGCLEKREIEVNYYNSGRSEMVRTGELDDMHGGGDTVMIHDFIELIRREQPDRVVASASESCDSHLLVFAAEVARLEKRVVNVEDYRKQIEESVQGISD